jgi:beta-lactamase regulating signal transducer with metallopeptidase domain
MMLLAELALRTSIPLAAALLVCLGLRGCSAALRHRVLSVGLLLAVLVLPLTALAPSWDVPLFNASAPPTVVRDTAVIVDSGAAGDGLLSTPADAPRPFTPEQAILIVWIAGLAVGAARMTVGLVRLRRTTAAARRLEDGSWSAAARTLAARFGITRPIDVLVTDRRDILATWGVVRPRLLLPADAPDWPAERIRVVLAHELAHIRRADWLVHMLADGFRMLFWFNPAAWLFAHRLRRESEHACDDQVLATGVEPDTYAFHLLDLARETRAAAFVRAAALSMARSSTLEGRIAAMLNRRLDRTLPSRWQMAAVVAALALVAVPASLVRVSAQAGSTLLTGVVYDPSGAVLPNVEVTLENEQKATAKTRSNSSGRFEFTSVGAGRYTLKADVPGFRPADDDLRVEGAGRLGTSGHPPGGGAAGNGQGVRAADGLRPPGGRTCGTGANRRQHQGAEEAASRGPCLPSGHARGRRRRHRAAGGAHRAGRERLLRANPERAGAPRAGFRCRRRGAPVVVQPDAPQRRGRRSADGRVGGVQPRREE